MYRGENNRTRRTQYTQYNRTRLSISSCSKLAGCQSERKLRGVH